MKLCIVMKIIHPKDIYKLTSVAPVTLNCYECKENFNRPKNRVLVALKGNSKTKLLYYSSKCSSVARKNRVKLKCSECNKNFEKVKSQTNKGGKNFCSHSCSARFHNLVKPKRRLEGLCKKCNKVISKTRKYCQKCSPKLDLNQTLAELRQTKGFKSNQYGKIRDHSRRISKNANLLNKCKICDYTKHVIACHIKSITKFHDSSTIGEINNIKNLVGLCPNHHWELDHKLLGQKKLKIIYS